MTQFQYQKTTKEDWIKTILYLSIFLGVIVVGAIVLDHYLPAYFPIWLILLGAGLFLLVGWHARKFAYSCPKCGHEFEISTFTDFISPHGVNKSGGWKYLKCPKCHEKSRANVIKKAKK